ncbi:hypothetical protein ACFSTD_18015 [Novosphingobium colocasiae]
MSLLASGGAECFCAPHGARSFPMHRCLRARPGNRLVPGLPAHDQRDRGVVYP